MARSGLASTGGSLPSPSVDVELPGRPGGPQRAGHHPSVLRLHGCRGLGVLARVAHPPHWHSAALPIQPAAVQAARPELLALRDALLGDRCDSFRGVALASLPLHGETSPVYSPFAEPTVSAMARSATAALTAQPGGALPAD